MYKYQKQTQQQDIGFFLMSLFFVIVFWFVFSVLDTAHASQIPEDRAVNALIGEAESLGYTGMLHIACSLRNRGHLRGVYGEKAPRVVNRKYSPKTLQDARRAWADSAKADITKGSDHWASKTLDQAWEKKMIKSGYTKTFEDKGHVFYRGKK